MSDRANVKHSRQSRPQPTPQPAQCIRWTVFASNEHGKVGVKSAFLV
jgi:hypothetical protein